MAASNNIPGLLPNLSRAQAPVPQNNHNFGQPRTNHMDVESEEEKTAQAAAQPPQGGRRRRRRSCTCKRKPCRHTRTSRRTRRRHKHRQTRRHRRR